MLYDYPLMGVIIKNLEQEREAIREEIMGPGSRSFASSSVKGSFISDTTGKAVTQLEENPKLKAIERELADYRRHKGQLERALDALTEEERRLVELFYFKKKGTWATTEALGVSERTLYRIKRQAILRIASLTKCVIPGI